MPLELRDCGPISRVGLGTWATFGDGVDAATARAVVGAALDAGITHIDTAPSYAGGTAEEWLGQFLADRTDVVISTKAYFDANRNPVGLGRVALFRSVEGSLKRLRRDCIDLLYCHRADPDTPLDETLAALAELRQQGKIRAWGISRWPAELVLQAAGLAGALGLPPPAAAQEPYNRLHPAPAAALKDALQSVPVPIIGYSVLARGTLTGKYLDAVPAGSRAERSRDCPQVWQADEAQARRIKRLLDVAKRAGVSAASLVIADALRFGPCAAILTGASSPEQVADIARGMALAEDGALTGAVEGIFGEPAH
ncbi:MAG: L-glyceraldehyde 3-phosphate reductase [Rhodospirillum sp.]|jgi:aryl-alcohol dehydrogenase-like predicted oxidoreductase|nr:L-glyceraldehyde 3-phosphate reductase [Rhodospirillum sp.]